MCDCVLTACTLCGCVCIFVLLCVCACLHNLCPYSRVESVCRCVGVYVPPDGDGQRLGRAGAGTDDVGSQPFSLKDVEEGVAGGDGP